MKINNWERILFHMYENQQKWCFFSKDIIYIQENAIGKDLNLSFQEFQSGFSFLEDMELIERKNDEDYWKISKNGLEVILNVKKHLDEEKHQDLIMFFTYILAFGAAAQIAEFFIKIYAISNKGLSIGIFLILIFAIYFITRNILK